MNLHNDEWKLRRAGE